MKKFIVPVKMISPDLGRANVRYLARFFMVDSQSLKRNRSSEYETVRIATKVHLRVRVNGSDHILPPQLIVEYKDIAATALNDDIDIQFSVSYEGSGTSFKDIVQFMLIAMILVAAYAGIRLYGWYQRNGGDCDQAACVVPTIILLIAGGGNVLALISLGISIWYLVAYKFQDYAVFMLPSRDDGEQLFTIVATCALVCKFIHCLHIVITQSRIDIFFLDWEQPKLAPIVNMTTQKQTTTTGSAIRRQPRSSHSDTINTQGPQEEKRPVSVWRTFFVGNEWNELQIIRRTNPIIQILFVMVLLDYAGLGNLATGDPYIDTKLSPTEYHSEYRLLLRFGISASLYLLFAFVQWFFFIFIYERWVADAARNFVDLCALSNISVFILSEEIHGYYIHGRLLHGHADTSQKKLAEFLEGESKDQAPLGGLFGTSQRTFEITVNRKVRSHVNMFLNKIMLASRNAQERKRTARGTAGASASDYQGLAEIQESLKGFVLRAIEKGGDGVPMNIMKLRKNFLENCLDIECTGPQEDDIIYFEDDGRSFEDVLLLGHEFTLVAFELLLFCVIDMFTMNATMAGIITYIISQVLIIIRANFGEQNVALKTGVDERFLI